MLDGWPSMWLIMGGGRGTLAITLTSAAKLRAVPANMRTIFWKSETSTSWVQMMYFHNAFFFKYSIMTSSLIKVMQKSTKCDFLLKIIQLLCLGFDFDLCLKLEKTEVWSWRCLDVENTKIPRWWFSWALAARLRPLLGSRKPWSWSRGWRCMFTILTIPPKPLSTKPIIEPTLTLDDPEDIVFTSIELTIPATKD